MSPKPIMGRRVRAPRRLIPAAVGAGVAAALLATNAWADPCKAIPDKGPMPSFLHRGVSFSGPVTYVGDGDGLCVAVGAGSGNWVEVRLADFYAPELSDPDGPAAKKVLEGLALGKAATCVAQKQSYDRVIAVCQVGGVSLGERMRSAGIAEAGRGRRSSDNAR